MTVDRSLSRGLADRILADFEAVAMQHVRACAGVVRRIPRKRADVRQIAGYLARQGERASLSQVVGNHPKWRWAVVAAFIPLSPEPEANEIRNRSTRFHLLPVHIHVDKFGVIPPVSAAMLEVREHALERLFQRLNSTDAESIRDEIHEAICLSPYLLGASRALQLKQVVLPTKSGAFLCSLTDRAGPVCAKTWIPYRDQETRHLRAARAIASCYETLGGPLVLAEAIAALPFGENLNQVDCFEEFQDVLSNFPWFWKEYEPGVDRDGEVWNFARAQADNSRQQSPKVAA